MNCWQMMHENECNKNSQAARNLFSRSRCAKESKEKERRARFGVVSFSPGVTFATQSSTIRAVYKNIQSTGISLYMRRRRRSRVYNSSVRIYHEQLWHLRGMIFRDRKGRGRWILWADCGREGWDKERENKTGSRDGSGELERRERWGRAACREGGQEEEDEEEEERDEERRVLDLGQRSEIIFPLRPCSSSSSISPDGGSEGEKSTTRRFAAAIIKLFTHTVRYLSSKQRDHNVLLFDPHFVSDLSLTASRDDMYLADPARSIWSTSHDLFAAALLWCGRTNRASDIQYYVNVARMLFLPPIESEFEHACWIETRCE